MSKNEVRIIVEHIIKSCLGLTQLFSELTASSVHELQVYNLISCRTVYEMQTYVLHVSMLGKALDSSFLNRISLRSVESRRSYQVTHPWKTHILYILKSFDCSTQSIWHGIMTFYGSLFIVLGAVRSLGIQIAGLHFCYAWGTY